MSVRFPIKTVYRRENTKFIVSVYLNFEK
jgi:hypothetical protein